MLPHSPLVVWKQKGKSQPGPRARPPPPPSLDPVLTPPRAEGQKELRAAQEGGDLGCPWSPLGFRRDVSRITEELAFQEEFQHSHRSGCGKARGW